MIENLKAIHVEDKHPVFYDVHSIDVKGQAVSYYNSDGTAVDVAPFEHIILLRWVNEGWQWEKLEEVPCYTEHDIKDFAKTLPVAGFANEGDSDRELEQIILRIIDRKFDEWKSNR